jgi:hypothetical protein
MSEELISDNEKTAFSSNKNSSCSLSEEDSFQSEEDSKKGLLRAAMNPSLEKITGLTSKIKTEETEEKCWKSPSKNGLSNSNEIIPKYYHKDYSKLLNVDYYDMIKDDIRNFRKLNSYQLDFIRDLDTKHKMEIIYLFNECTNAIHKLLI